ALAATAVLAVEALRLVHARRRPVQLSPLERALRLTREAAGRSDPADRRKALSLLSQTLEDDGATAIADAAGGAAWSGSAPSPEVALRIAEEAETGGNSR